MFQRFKRFFKLSHTCLRLSQLFRDIFYQLAEDSPDNELVVIIPLPMRSMYSCMDIPKALACSCSPFLAVGVRNPDSRAVLGSPQELLPILSILNAHSIPSILQITVYFYIADIRLNLIAVICNMDFVHQHHGDNIARILPHVRTLVGLSIPRSISVSSYYQCSEPWQVYRLEHGIKHRLVKSFRNRNEADALVRFLNRNTVFQFTVAFDQQPLESQNPSPVAAENGQLVNSMQTEINS